ncbi:MBL fold metallo-hydrolase [Mesorhizobium sp.]|uniref:MBL fold metallo-hydrolase n=1 Tax=Mesorhizobium sp. TaxID=1871066 RepID=UPI00122700C2|nr:MBL fold metallo-hydrolase [Mesorhizobium sp.]TIO04769.1 MAG: MBL fold metallo-hydrolase [Mesorhizobium sp.]TIO35001.1 MAG: MBL fold metallo-hydrolase [Mesorhizobium sp.]TIP12212.1 MAG: MBL fold metallo-hydrolase [Mesorhizobium sp.]
MKITLLPSEKGDCLLIEAGAVSILADGGMPGSYASEVRGFLGKWAEDTGKDLDLVYVSHVDQDHIAGVLQLLEDTVQWRVFEHKRANGQPATKPPFKKPPEVKRIWHNAFRTMVDESEAIGTVLAARANTLSSSANPSLLRLADAFRSVANSIPEAIKVSRRIAADQLNIPLNGEFGNLLAMVRGQEVISLAAASTLAIRVIGPAKKDLEILRKYWKAWLADNPGSVDKLEAWLEDNEGPIPPGLGVSIDDELGNRKSVTEPNLASLMLLLEEPKPGGGVTRVILTGDGHSDDILAGLTHHGRLADGTGLHVDALKLQHHGSEHNLDRSFAKRITADHYLICANGEHENPDLRVLEVLLDSRLGTLDKLSPNPETSRPFTIWLNCSTDYLEKQQVAHIARKGAPSDKLAKCIAQFTAVEQKLADAKQASNGRLKLKYLKASPLKLEV